MELINTDDMIQTENHSTRIPVVLCLDTSGSMTFNGGFQALNEGVRSFYETCQNDPINRFGFEVAIVTFGAQGVTKVQDFRPDYKQKDVPEFKYLKPPENNDAGTPMGKGVDLAIKGLSKRKIEYKNNAIGYYQPFLVIITDGQSSEINKAWFVDNEEGYRASCKQFHDTQEQVVALQKNRKLKVIAIGVGNDDFSELAGFVVDKKILLAKDFTGFDAVFEFMSQSISSSAASYATEGEVEESPLAQIAENLEDEGIISISIEDFGRDED